MVSKCHNPRCNAEFRYFGDGKLFEFPPESASDGTELFWLCESCCRTHTVERKEDGHIHLCARSDEIRRHTDLEKAS